MGMAGAKGTKEPLGFRFCWKHRGFGRFGKDVLTKKETVFRLSLWWARWDLNPCYANQPVIDWLAKAGASPLFRRPRDNGFRCNN